MTRPAGDDLAVRGTQVHRVAGVEPAFHPGDPGGQQRRAAALDGLGGALVQQQPAMADGRMGQPQLPGAGPPPGRGDEVGPQRLPVQRLPGRGGAATTVGMPASVAIIAASTLVTMPPVPTGWPRWRWPCPG